MADGVQVPFAKSRLREEVMPHGESNRVREVGDRTASAGGGCSLAPVRNERVSRPRKQGRGLPIPRITRFLTTQPLPLHRSGKSRVVMARRTNPTALKLCDARNQGAMPRGPRTRVTMDFKSRRRVEGAGGILQHAIKKHYVASSSRKLLGQLKHSCRSPNSVCAQRTTTDYINAISFALQPLFVQTGTSFRNAWKRFMSSCTCSIVGTNPKPSKTPKSLSMATDSLA